MMQTLDIDVFCALPMSHRHFFSRRIGSLIGTASIVPGMPGIVGGTSVHGKLQKHIRKPSEFQNGDAASQVLTLPHVAIKTIPSARSRSGGGSIEAANTVGAGITSVPGISAKFA